MQTLSVGRTLAAPAPRYSQPLLGQGKKFANFIKFWREEESITNAASGRYEGGFALLCSNRPQAWLLIDKKMWFLSLENIRYDMISEVDYSARLLDATVFIRTINKVMRFTTPPPEAVARADRAAMYSG